MIYIDLGKLGITHLEMDLTEKSSAESIVFCLLLQAQSGDS